MKFLLVTSYLQLSLNPSLAISLTSSLVLACEGSELKGYTRKQANSRSITKHMINGGTNSFKFHSSPRMVCFLSYYVSISDTSLIDK